MALQISRDSGSTGALCHSKKEKINREIYTYVGGGTDDDIWIGGNGNVGEAVEATAVSEEAIKDAATAAATAAVSWEASSMLVGIKAPVEVGEAEMNKKENVWMKRKLNITGSRFYKRVD